MTPSSSPSSGEQPHGRVDRMRREMFNTYPEPTLIEEDEMADVQAGPAKPRDERAIMRRMSADISEADAILCELWERQQTQFDKDAVRRVRGLLAGWRLESE